VEKKKYAMEDVIEKLKAFLDNQSSYEGAELPKTNDKVHLNTEKFMEVIQNVLGVEELEHNDDMDDSDDIDNDDPTEEQNEIRELMEEMDLELAGTTIGESFEKVKTLEEIIEKENKAHKKQSESSVNFNDEPKKR